MTSPKDNPNFGQYALITNSFGQGAVPLIFSGDAMDKARQAAEFADANTGEVSSVTGPFTVEQLPEGVRYPFGTWEEIDPVTQHWQCYALH